MLELPGIFQEPFLGNLFWETLSQEALSGETLFRKRGIQSISWDFLFLGLWQTHASAYMDHNKNARCNPAFTGLLMVRYVTERFPRVSGEASALQEPSSQ